MKPVLRYALWLCPPVAIALLALAAFPHLDRGRDDDRIGAFRFGGGESISTVNVEGLPLAIEISPRDFELLLRRENRELFKDRAINAEIEFGGLPPRQAVLSLRGRGSLRYKGAPPNYDISLLSADEFAPGVRLKRFYLMNMAYDRHQWKLAFGYGLAQQLELFPPHFQFVRVTVNDEAQGCFLLVEPPEAAIRRQYPDCVAIYRRRERDEYDTEWTAAVPAVHSTLSRFRSLNDRPTSGAGAPSAEEYAEVLNLPLYYKWLAVNTVLGNADTLDEIFLYERRDDPNVPGKLSVMGWDYDDIGRPPKEGSLSDPLLYASLDLFGEHLQANRELYGEFRAALLTLTEGDLSADALAARLDQTRVLRDSLEETGDPESSAASRARQLAVDKMRRFVEGRHLAIGEALGDANPQSGESASPCD